MTKEEWIHWFIGNVLPHPYNEWGISKDEFNYVNGWNSMRVEILTRLGQVKEVENGESKLSL